jgi:hypothetical protein
MCCMMPKKKAKIYFIFKDSTRGLIFIPEKSGFKDLITMLKSYPLLINLYMRKQIDLCMYISMVIMNTVAHSLFKNHYSLVHNFQFHVHSTFDYNRVSIPEI